MTVEMIKDTLLTGNIIIVKGKNRTFIDRNRPGFTKAIAPFNNCKVIEMKATRYGRDEVAIEITVK